jgi:protein-L-isoaspartate(D-aspartate) O-methyltransferase
VPIDPPTIPWREARASPSEAFEPPEAVELRAELVANLVASGDVKTQRVRQALLRVPRHKFVPYEAALEDAYANRPLAIGWGQTISQPAVVAWTCDALDLDGSERVLEIGTGSGYQAALLAVLARRVYSVELFPDLSERAAALLAELGYDNVRVRQGDGAFGWPSRAPFDRVVAAAASPLVPQAWLDQLAPGGILVAPVGPDRAQSHVRLRKQAGGAIAREDLGLVSFVPLLGT